MTRPLCGWCTGPPGSRPPHVHTHPTTCACDDARHDKPEPEES